MSEKFNLVKRHFDNEMWDEKRVRDSVVKNWITKEEFKTITGKTY